MTDPFGAVPNLKEFRIEVVARDMPSPKSHACNTSLTRGIVALLDVPHQTLAHRMGITPARFASVLHGHLGASEDFRAGFREAISEELDVRLFPEREAKK